MYLRLEHLYFWQKRTELLKDISFTLASGDRLGLVGSNGSGKSTLLKLLSGDLNPESGVIMRTPGLRMLRLAQSPFFNEGTVWQVASKALVDVQKLEQQLREEEQRMGENLDHYQKLSDMFEFLGAYQAEVNLEKTLEQFGLIKEQDVATLSGGEQMRLALAMVLSQRPEVLLLDEPTNHLDLSIKKYLAKQLAHYPGALVIASHDRAFLDQVCNQTAFLKDGELKLYKGNYTRAQMQRSKQDASQMPISLQTKAQKQTVLTAKHLSKKGDQRVLLDNLSFRLEAGDKIALLGANGSGKSTLLKMLAGELESENPKVEIQWLGEAKVFYLDQMSRGVDDAPLLDQLTVFVTLERARMLLALVGIPSEFWLQTPQVLSQGQKARVGLAKMIASEANVLLLDEPTNDLDIQMIELLEATLASGDVTCMLVTHDQKLIEHLATQVWVLDSSLQRYASLKDYEQERPQVTDTEPEAIQELTETPEEKQDRLEIERSELIEHLFDPLSFSERDYLRSTERLQELEDELTVLYDQLLPPPQPRYQINLNGVYVYADKSDNDIRFGSNTPLQIKVHLQNKVAHLVLQEPEDSCLLRWARHNLIHGITRLCFLYFNVTVVQHQSKLNLSKTLLQSSGNHWWTLHRERFEKLEGWDRQGRGAKGEGLGKKKKFRKRTKKLQHANNSRGEKKHL